MSRPKSNEERLWSKAGRDTNVAWLLQSALSDQVASRILLTPPSELFPRYELPADEFYLPFQSRGLPYLSDESQSLLRSLTKVAQHDPNRRSEAAQRQIAMETQEQLNNATAEEFRDGMVLAMIETVRRNRSLLRMVNARSTTTRHHLRERVKDYSQIDFSAFESYLLELMPFLKKGKQKRAFQNVGKEFEAYLASAQLDRVRRILVFITAARFPQILKIRRVREGEWREFLVQLVEREFLLQSSALTLWCSRCKTTGELSCSPVIYLSSQVVCPSCGRPAYAISTFRPTGSLDVAMGSKDGVLGASIGWHLRRHKIRFEHSYKLAGKEFDFLLPSRNGSRLIECKMHQVSVSEQNMISNVLESRNQLHQHVQLARRHGIQLSRAACVVNLSSELLRRFLRKVGPETDPEYKRVWVRIISYEDFPRWLRES